MFLRFRLLIFALVPVVIAASIRLQILLPAEGDKGWLLHVAHQWLVGNRLYVKIFEVNPPLIVWLYALPVWFSLHVGWLRDYEALAVMGLVASAVSTVIGTCLIARHPAFEGQRSKQIKFGFLQALIFIFYTTQAYFFDREHILIVLAFPYMLRFMPQLAERKIPLWLAVVTGCMAAVGFCIKPHAMLIFAALQLFALVRTHSVRSLLTIENFIVAAGAGIYALCTWIFAPEYYQVVMPMAIDTYASFRNDNAGYVYLPPVFIALGLMFSDFRPRHNTPYRRDIYYLVGLCAAFLAYARINNGWGYSYNPLYCVMMLTAAWLLWEYDFIRLEFEEQNVSERSIYFGLRGCFIVLIAHAAYMIFYFTLMNYNLDKMRWPCKENPDCWRHSPYEQYFQDHDVKTFGTMTFDFSAWVTLMRLSQTEWVTRFNHLWMMPKLLLANDDYTAQHYWIIEYVAKGLAEDLKNNKPDVVIVDGSPGLMGLAKPFSLPKTLSAVPEFAEQWSHYTYQTHFNSCAPHYEKTASECLYDLYSRTPMTRSDKYALATLLPLLALSAVMQMFAFNSADKTWLLVAARFWLEGKQLYVGVVEVNPPFILWLYSVPVWLSQKLGVLTDYQMLGFLGLIASWLCIVICVRLIKRYPAFEGSVRRRTEFTLLIAAIFIFLTPQSFFFDREHILYMLTFPYVMRFMPGLADQKQPWALRLAIGLVAAAGFCVKPHTLILFAAVQLLFFIRERSARILWSVENAIIYLGAAIYLLCVWRFAPEYVTLILPMALETYSAFGRNGGGLLCLPPALLAAGLIFADFRLRHTSPYRSDIYYFIGIAVAFLAHALASNGWDYTYHPLMCTLTLLAGLVLCEYQWLRQHNSSSGMPGEKGFMFGIRGCAICLATQGIYMALMTFTSVGVASVQVRCHRTPACIMNDPYIRYVRDHDVHSFGTITQDFPKWVEVVRVTGAHWETRFNHLWMLPKLLQEGGVPTQQHAWIARYVADALAEDLDNRKPEIVFVDTGRQFAIYPGYIDLLEFLSETAQFKTAWSHYRYSSTLDECDKPQTSVFKGACRYNIYRRIEPQTEHP